MRWLITITGLGAFGFAAFRLWSAAARRGLVYAGGDAPKRGNLIGGLGFEQVLEPEYVHVYEEQHSLEARTDHDASGDENVRS